MIVEPFTANLPTKPTLNIYGILGIIQLLSGPYLIVVKERKLVSKIFGHYIWRITGSDVLPLSNHLKNLNEQQRIDEEKFVSLLKSFLSSEWLYYSSTYDLTRNIQTQVNAKGNKTTLLPADMNFVVNKFISSPFTEILEARTDTRLEDFLIFCIEGFVEIQSLIMNNQKKVTFGLISRRATGRVGKKYFETLFIDDLFRHKIPFTWHG